MAGLELLFLRIGEEMSRKSRMCGHRKQQQQEHWSSARLLDFRCCRLQSCTLRSTSLIGSRPGRHSIFRTGSSTISKAGGNGVAIERPSAVAHGLPKADLDARR